MKLFAQPKSSQRASSEEIRSLLKLAKKSPKPVFSSPAPNPAPREDDQEPFALEFDDAYSFACYFLPDLSFHRWQVEELLRLSGWNSIKEWQDDHPKQVFTDKAPCIYHLPAANGSGKDSFLLAVWSLWLICCHKHALVIATSSSVRQITDQTWTYIKLYADLINKKLGATYLDIVHHRIKTGGLSVLKCFVTDEASKAEGYHKLPGEAAGPFVIIVNEAKTITEDIWGALFRCHGFSHWIEVSSPGEDSGHFYERVQNSVKYPAPLRPLEWWSRRITAFDCPHLETAIEIARTTLPGGLDHPLARSSLLAQFITHNSLRFIRSEYIRTLKEIPGTVRAGIDLALAEGGDERVVAIWSGNYLLKEYSSMETDPEKLALWIGNILRRYRVRPGHTKADGGGVGIAIIKILNNQDDNWEIHSIINNSKPSNPRLFSNRGSELLWRFAENLRTGAIFFDQKKFPKLYEQALSRKFELDGGKIKAEDKKKMAKSPDRLDASVLAVSDIIPAYKRVAATLVSEKQKFSYQKLYESLNDRFSNTGMVSARRARAAKQSSTARIAYNEYTSEGSRDDLGRRDPY